MELWFKKNQKWFRSFFLCDQIARTLGVGDFLDQIPLNHVIVVRNCQNTKGYALYFGTHWGFAYTQSSSDLIAQKKWSKSFLVFLKPQLHIIKLLKKSSRERFRAFLMPKTKNTIFRNGFPPGNSTHLPDERDILKSILRISARLFENAPTGR